ncbi:hypothetical protein CP8484711_1907B, partial [Chlamydia psittaci 84-8471/1]
DVSVFVFKRFITINTIPSIKKDSK